MTVFEVLFLGLVQGLTEFLPVSSSGHLVVSQYFLDVTAAEASLSFDIFLHFSTLLAVILFFRKRILKLRVRDFVYLGVASVPAAVLGILFRHAIESVFSSFYFVLGTLFVTGLLNFRTSSLLKKRDESFEPAAMSVKKAMSIGLFQAAALLPGISRSGSTVFAGVQSKLSRKEAFEFSFVMSIPIILGGSLVQLLDVYRDGEFLSIDPGLFLLGGAAAFITGIVSLTVFRQVIERAKLEWFGWYCMALVFVLLLFEVFPKV